MKINILKKIFFFHEKFTFILILICIALLLNELNLKKKINNNNNYKIFSNKEKEYFFNKISKKYNKNISNSDILYIKGKSQFGNFIISLNNAIFICELIGCKSVVIENNNKLYIKNKILYNKYNISIEPNCSLNFNNNNIIIEKVTFFYYYNFTFMKRKNRINILKQEIIKNLPIIKTNINDLYIHIRSGDIFRGYGRYYSQPPLCFYEKILNKFNFHNIFIISENLFNPVINRILNIYPYVKYKQNNISIDISYLANSYNIVSSVSSFLVSIIKLNDKLKYLWEYDIYKLSERYLHLHYSVYDFSFNYTIYKMNASTKYKKKMKVWRCNKEQLNLMMNEKCSNEFDIIKPRI